MTELINEQEAYEEYVNSCCSDFNVFVTELNFKEWRLTGRPKTINPKDGYWPTPWPKGETQ